jgi:CBS domain-containing protein
VAQTVREVMSKSIVTAEASQTAADVAQLMKQNDIGAVVVTDNGELRGIVTDRDIAIRLVAENKGPDTAIREATSMNLDTVGPDTDLDQVVQRMRSSNVRRIPVVENGRPVGVLSLGDLAMERDSGSALADISAAPGNA